MKNKETIEEVAQKLYGKGNDLATVSMRNRFIEGAKWQQERMYSEEEVYTKLHNLMTEIKLNSLVINDDMDLKQWFNQNKKK